MSVLDRLTDCLQTIEIKQCRCGFLVIDFYGHSMQFHQEFINPDGTMKENTVAELQKIESNKKSTIPQETSDTPKDKSDKESHGKEHNRTVEPAQNVNCKQRSEYLESPKPERSDLREVIDKASPKINQVIQDEEHIRISRPIQDVSCGQRSDQQEVPSPEKSNPREAADNVNIRIIRRRLWNLQHVLKPN